MTYELNNIRKDMELFNGDLKKTSPVVEVFAAMINGESLDRFGKKADKAVAYIKELGTRANNGDVNAAIELNTMRRWIVEAPILDEMKMLGIFGSYQNVAYDEAIEREVYDYAGEASREQANNGDPVFTLATKNVYPVPTFTVSGGYEVDYRKIELGDMSKEYEGMQYVKTDILNNANRAIITKVYKAIKAATGIKHVFEGAGLTKAGVDAVITALRRYGRLTIAGDYATISQFSPWAGYVGSVNSNTILGISQKAMEEIAQNGNLSMYNGALLNVIDNPYNESKLNAAGDNFETLFPAGLAFVIPTGDKSPIKTWTRGGLTSLQGVDVKSGKIITRFDLEVACDVAKGREHQIGMIYDSQIGGLQ